MTLRVTKLAISAVLLACTTILDGIRRVVGLPVPGRCIVLSYHSVQPWHRQRFARQMDELMRRAVPLHADHRGSLASGVRHAIVTFDDGFRSVVDHALPELAVRGIPATLFVPTGHVGGRPGWIGDDHPDSRQSILSLQEVAALPSPLVSVGSHTISHPILSELDPVEVRGELAGSRSCLEECTRQPVRLLALPHGRYDDDVLSESRAAGYDRVFTVEPVWALRRPDEFLTGRVVVDPADWPCEFRLKLAGAYRWQPLASALKRRFVR